MERPKTIPLTLLTIAGPALEPLRLEGEASMLIGRARECHLCLADETVSRSHAAISHRAGDWFIEDRESRHGTRLNGVRLDPRRRTPLADGDLIIIGPWTFRAALDPAPGVSESRSEALAAPLPTDAPVEAGEVRAVPPTGNTRLARSQLSLLIDCATSLAMDGNEEALADRLVETALEGTDFERAALLRPAGGDAIEIVAYAARSSRANEPPTFSRSLMAAAAIEGLVRLSERTLNTAAIGLGASIAEMEITAALCAPLAVGDTTAAFLYLDARESQASASDSDQAEFCRALARMGGLALANLKRVDLEHRWARLGAHLDAAREAQRLMTPREEGIVGPTAYAFAMRPGSDLAGDLFDVVPLDEHRTAIVLGDVTGEGVDAAFVMAATQAHLHGTLVRECDPVAAVSAANEYVTSHVPMGRFVTLWLGVMDARTRTVSIVDAGHGHWMLRRPDGSTQPNARAGGIPLGIESTYAFTTKTITLGPGERIILYTDGIIEQPSPGGEMFSAARVIEAIARTTTPQEDVAAVREALHRFAWTERWSDDATVASIGWADEGPVTMPTAPPGSPSSA